MEDVPTIKSQESSKINSENRENQNPCNIHPSFHMVVFFIPIDMKKLKRSKACDKSCEGRSRDEDDIEVNIFWEFSEVDKVCKNIEWIRKEKKPEKKEYPMENSFFLHGHHREKVWDQGEDNVPYEPPENGISREVSAKYPEKSCVETEGDVSMEMHKKLRMKN